MIFEVNKNILEELVKPITRKQIALVAKTSAQSVTNAMTDTGDYPVSTKTKENIANAIIELAYKKHRLLATIQMPTVAE